MGETVEDVGKENELQYKNTIFSADMEKLSIEEKKTEKTRKLRE